MTEENITAELIRSDGANRWLLLKGAVTGVLKYNGHGMMYESIELNDAEIARVRNRALRLGYWLVPKIEFTLPVGSGVAKAVIEVRARGHRLLSGFRLCVGGQVLYAEGFYADFPDAELPLPSNAADLDIQELPIASEAKVDES